MKTVLQDLTLLHKSVICYFITGHYGAFLQEEWDLLQRMSKYLEREQDEIIIERRLGILGIWGKGGASCFFGQSCVWVLKGWLHSFFFFFFLNFLLYSSGTLKILGGIPLQTHTRSAKRLLYLKQTSGERESTKFQSHMIAQWLSNSRNSRSPSALVFHFEVLRCQESCFCLKPQLPLSDQLHVLFLSTAQQIMPFFS